MKCYNNNCNKECDIYTKAICLYRMTKEQRQLIDQIYENDRCECGGLKINRILKKSRIKVNVCTKCRSIEKEEMMKSV